MCFMYKCSNSLVPDYISDIIPPLVGDVSKYSLRNRQNLANVYMSTRTEISRRSCIPSSVSSWNKLSNDMREADTYLSFRTAVKRDILCGTHVPSYYMKGQRRLSVLHARIRNKCSDLNRDLYQNHLTIDPSCSCGNDNENALQLCKNNNVSKHAKLSPT